MNEKRNKKRRSGEDEEEKNRMWKIANNSQNTQVFGVRISVINLQFTANKILM